MEQVKEPFARYRTAAGKTIKEVAHELGVDKTTIIRWEKGRPRIPVKRLKDASVLLGCRRIDLRPDIMGVAE